MSKTAESESLMEALEAYFDKSLTLKQTAAGSRSSMTAVMARYHAIGIPGEIKGAFNAELARYTIIDDGSMA